jgi:CheY-like chemotaxis protein
LLLEDNPGDAYLIEEHLEEFASFSYVFKNVGTLNEALTVLKKQPYDVILLDLELPDTRELSINIALQYTLLIFRISQVNI